MTVGGVIGRIQDPGIDFPGIRPYLHVEVYLNGQAVDPAEWGDIFWPDHPVENAGSDIHWDIVDWPNRRLARQARRAWAAQDHAAAATLYRRALTFAQRILLAFLELELDFAEGALPSRTLGTIAAVPSPESLRIQIFHQMTNLHAYEAGEPTVIFD